MPLNGFILCFEKLSCYSTQLFKKCFTCSSIAACILDSRWCNNSCCTYKELGQGYFYYSIRKKAPSLLIYLQPTPKKCYHKKNHAYLNLVYSICPRVNIHQSATPSCSVAKCPPKTTFFCIFCFDNGYFKRFHRPNF